MDPYPLSFLRHAPPPRHHPSDRLQPLSRRRVLQLASASAAGLLLPRSLAAAAVSNSKDLAVPRGLLSPQEAARGLADGRLQAVDLRDRQHLRGPFAFDGGQIPGSCPLANEALSGPDYNPGALPQAQAWRRRLAEAGIQPDLPALLVPAGPGLGPLGVACRAAWLIRYTGLPEPRLLAGGLEAWVDAGLPLELDTLQDHRNRQSRLWTPRLAQFEAITPLKALHADSEMLWAGLAYSAQSRSAPRVLDLRTHDSHQGVTRHRLAARWGRIPGSRSLPIRLWLTEDRQSLLPAPALQQMAAQHGLLTDDPLVLTCNTGLLAAVAWYALAVVLQRPNVAVHAESVVGWARAGLPMEAEPSRLEQLRRSVTQQGVEA